MRTTPRSLRRRPRGAIKVEKRSPSPALSKARSHFCADFQSTCNSYMQINVTYATCFHMKPFKKHSLHEVSPFVFNKWVPPIGNASEREGGQT